MYIACISYTCMCVQQNLSLICELKSTCVLTSYVASVQIRRHHGVIRFVGVEELVVHVVDSQRRQNVRLYNVTWRRRSAVTRPCCVTIVWQLGQIQAKYALMWSIPCPEQEATKGCKVHVIKPKQLDLCTKFRAKNLWYRGLSK